MHHLFLVAANLAAIVSNYCTNVVMARGLGPNDYSQIVWGLSLAALFQQIILFGTPGFIIKNTYTNTEARVESCDINRVVFINIVIGLVLSLGLYIFFEKINAVALLLVFSAIPLALVDVRVFEAQAKKEFSAASFVSVLYPVIKIIIVPLAVISFGSPLWVSLAVLFGAMLASFAAGHLFGSRFICDACKPLPCRTFFANFKKTVIQLLPFGYDPIIYSLYYQLPLLFLGFYASSSLSSFYIAYTTIGAFYIIPSVLFQKVFPSYFSDFVYNGTDSFFDFEKMAHRYGWYLLSSVGLTIGVVLCSPYLVMIVFGEGYTFAIGVIKIMSIAIPARFVSMSIGSIFVTTNDVFSKNKIISTLLVFAFTLYLFSAKMNGAYGVAVSYVVLEYVWALLFLLRLKNSDIFRKYKQAAAPN